jgi:hypothetical protein
MQPENFLGPKKGYLDRYTYTFFSSFSWGLNTGTKGEKVVIFGLSTGTISGKKIFFFKYSEFIFGTGTKSEKYQFFVFSTSTKSPKNRRKKFKQSSF